MPHVKIQISDNTGIEVTAQESVVFIPGGVTPTSALDANNCLYISSGQLPTIKEIMGAVDKEANVVVIGTVALVEKCLEAGLDVIYCKVPDYSTSTLLPASLDFLNDKDTYNVKFLTTGYLGGITITKGNEKATLSDSTGENTNGYTFGEDSPYDKLAKIAQKRTDCIVLAHAFYYGATADVKRDETSKKCLLTKVDANLGNGDILAVQVSNHLKTYFATDSSDPLGSYVYALVPNVEQSVYLQAMEDSTTLIMPSIYTYLTKYGQALNNGQEWLSLANSERGSVVGLGTPDLTVTKYVLDNYVLKDPIYNEVDSAKSGVSVNGIVELRPYGNVIWGDRTCRFVDNTGVKATLYQSLRALLCDVSKRAYQSAVKYTYESNNDITWFNFKSRVTSLLSEAVAAGVLNGFDMKKEASDALNTITCKIIMYPNLPVENFVVYINLENAAVSTDEGTKG